MKAKAKKAPMCSVSLLAIRLKGLAAPGEALKIKIYRICIIVSLWPSQAAACHSNSGPEEPMMAS